MEAWATAKDLARLYNVAPGTILRWAREDTWRRTTGRPVRYRWEDAQASYEKRHVNRIQRHLQSRLTR